MESFSKTINKQKLVDDYKLTEEDFYPPQDDRLYCSGIDDIVDGDNFDDYAEWFYENYENELFDV